VDSAFAKICKGCFASTKYSPELDVTPELDENDTRLCQEWVGILRWAVELGRLDIYLEVSLISSHDANILHIFAYLKRRDKLTLAFDPRHPPIDENRFQEYDWHDFYPDASEAIPDNLPEARGKEISITCFVDASHASNLKTRRSHTGILIFINRAPIIWYSKRQNTVKSSTFGSEFIALKTAIEMIIGLRFKLRCFGIQIDGSTNIMCDNEPVTKNVRIPQSTLSKKHNAVAYHKCREAVAANIYRCAHEPSPTNLADLFTKKRVQQSEIG